VSASQPELKNVFRSIGSAWQQKIIGHEGDFDRRSILALGAWVHEFCHFIQQMTRIQGIESLQFAQLQAAYTNEYLSKVRDSFHNSSFWPPSIPMVDYVANQDKCTSSILKEWLMAWTSLEVPRMLSLGRPLYSREAYLVEEWLDVHYRRLQELHMSDLSFPETPFPQLKERDKAGNTQTISLTTSAILENEANYITYEFLNSFFPEEVWEIMDELIGNVDHQNFGLVLAMMKDGTNLLLPLLSDLAMQIPFYTGWLDIKDYRTRNASWRFYDAYECVKQKYSGMTGPETEKHVREIVRYIETNCGWPNHSRMMEDFIESLQKGKRPGLTGPIEKLALYHINNRLNSPEHYAFLPVWLDHIGAESYCPFVAFYDESGEVAHTHGFGSSLLSDEEIVRLTFQTYFLWSAREIATAQNLVRCPICHLVQNRPGCSRCMFHSWFKSTWGFDPYSVN
jgi:hypothetical protein